MGRKIVTLGMALLLGVFLWSPVTFSAEMVSPASSETMALNQKMKAYQQRLNKPGEYRILLTFQEEDIILEKIISITVKDEQNHIKYAVSAFDGQLSIERAKQFELEDWIAWADIHIYNQTENYEETISYIDTSNIAYAPGMYEVFFGNAHVGGSFIVTLFYENEGTSEQRDETATTMNNTDESTIGEVFNKNQAYLNIEEYGTLIEAEEKQVLYILSGIIVLFFVFLVVLLYTQFSLLKNTLKKIITFFE